jgi:uncharacterized membrane protein YhhN
VRAALALVGVAAVLAYFIGLAFDFAALRVAVKPLPVLCLAVWAASGGTRSARLLSGGLLLSALGDLLLEGPDLFAAGLGAFLLAHLLYAAAFVQRGRGLHALRALPFAGYGAALFAILRPGLGALVVPVAAYVAAICVMMWRAAAALASAAPRIARPALGGALMFAASDTLIGLDRFRAPIPGVRYPIMLLYWLGQAGIALSARRESSS